MAKYNTHKNTPTGKRATIERKIRHAAKRAPATVVSLTELAKELNVKVVA